ncbi:MAG: threonine ammonia-lyase IlvA [Candidatus Paceibacterota bacterium]
MKTPAISQLVDQAARTIHEISQKTPLQFSRRLSMKYSANIYLKREDLQIVRSFKIRGAYNLISSLDIKDKKSGVVCASAGNHAQGVAQSCYEQKIKGTIFMPVSTSKQKVDRVKYFGSEWVSVQLIGNTFDESCKAAKSFCKKHRAFFVHPFDDMRIIYGNGTIAKEILEELGERIDYVLCTIGGGGLISGVGSYMKENMKSIKLVGVEPNGAAAMHKSINSEKIVTLGKIDPFVDGAAVQTVGTNTYKIISSVVDDILVIDEGKVCNTMIDLYQNNGIVGEPAGVMSVSALDSIQNEIEGRTVVCILSGGNNDMYRYPEIIRRAEAYLNKSS